VAHPSAYLVYGLRLSDGDGEWTFREFEPATDANDYVEWFTMPWFTERFGDSTNRDAVMADPAGLLADRLRGEGVEGVDGVTIAWPSTCGESTGEYLLVVDPRAGGSEEGVYDVDPAALVRRADVETWDALLERARVALGVTFADPDVRPSWFLTVEYG